MVAWNKHKLLSSFVFFIIFASSIHPFIHPGHKRFSFRQRRYISIVSIDVVPRMESMSILSLLLLVAAVISSTGAFCPRRSTFPWTATTTVSGTQRNGIFDKVGEFFEELDAFVDDAMSRRLGNGSKFYGKRKSNFYGTEDKDRKQDRMMVDPTEDYQGPTSSGFFKWMPDENGQMRPVTRMKEKTLDKPGTWSKAFTDSDE